MRIKSRSLFICMLSLMSLITKSQDKESTMKKPLIDLGFPPVQFKKTINQQFGSLITGLSKTAIGNFVSLDLKETEVSANFNSIFKNGSVLSVKVGGGVSDGLFSIFNSSKLNSKVSLDVQYNGLSYFTKRSLSFFEDSYREYSKKKNQLEYDYNEKKLAIESNNESSQFLIEKNKLNDKIKLAEHDIDSLGKLTTNNLIQAQININKYEIIQSKEKIKFIENAIANPVSTNGALSDDLENWKAKESKKLKADIEIAGFKFGWFSYGYKVKKSDFKLFDSTASFGDQILDSNNVSHELRVQYSYYDWSAVPNVSLFMCAGLAFSVDDNFNTLTKTDIEESRDFGPNPGDRKMVNKYNAYMGDYKKCLKGLRIYADIYKFFLKENALAIHGYPEIQIKDKQKPVSNLGFGLLFSLKDAKDESSIVNTELYYNLTDVFNVKESDNGFFERNDIGLRFTFPIKFKTQ